MMSPLFKAILKFCNTNHLFTNEGNFAKGGSCLTHPAFGRPSYLIVTGKQIQTKSYYRRLTRVHK